MKRGIMKWMAAVLTAGIIIIGGMTALPVQAEEKYEFVELENIDELEKRIIRVSEADLDVEATKMLEYGNTYCKDDKIIYIAYYTDGLKYADADKHIFYWMKKTGEEANSLVDNRVDDAWPTLISTPKVLLQSGNYSKVYLLTRKSSAGTSSQPAENNNASAQSHTHTYTWITVQEASAEQDGIEEYRCACGDVQERAVIPASQVFVKGLYGAIKDAPENGTAAYDSKNLYTISDYVIKKLAERTDVTTVIRFTYQGTAYQMTIPAGTDFTALLTDADYFYGYFYFAAQTGAVIEAA